ncbi:hypothetical protein AGRO_1169 [Agrobacterium sp. ATCC 31749]|uniref:hypothetical protein n=1 Tax=unclassified Agrobacterium TaxID=2632611 RepID=UPI00020DB597|nr:MULTISPECIES: hypothetical protein [unclassified Agrobacterium]EGL66044.1 hypothetical protein AGRO_1169 [Agrobacterium sp. ATCC 31749]QKW97491.1 hypothetical protein GSF67_10550 [Agrobacterium sp. CGMCC 11546]
MMLTGFLTPRKMAIAMAAVKGDSLSCGLRYRRPAKLLRFFDFACKAAVECLPEG